jgi:hypothetical protein
MRLVFKLLFTFLSIAKMNAQVPFLKLIKIVLDSTTLVRSFLLKKTPFNIHVLFNSNYSLGGYCDASNGSIYCVKLNKSNGK